MSFCFWVICVTNVAFGTLGVTELICLKSPVLPLRDRFKFSLCRILMLQVSESVQHRPFQIGENKLQLTG